MTEDALTRLRFSRALNRLGETILGTDEPSSLLHALAHIAGETLGVDRALVFDVRVDELHVGRLTEWLRPESAALPPPEGMFPIERSRGLLWELWSRRNWMESHAEAPHPMLEKDATTLLHQEMKVDSALWYPFYFREQGYHLLVFHQLTPRHWLDEELEFMAAVGKRVTLALGKLGLLEELAASQARYRELYDYTPSMFFTVTRERKVSSVNRFAAEHLGFDERDLLGSDVLDVFVPEDRETIDRQLDECFLHPGQVFRWEARKVRKDGTVISVREIARTGISTTGQSEALIVCDDVTEQKRTEQAMLQTQKLETLGVLVGGISHDFNNLLGAIVGNAELGLLRLPADSPAREPVELAALAALRAAELVKQLLTYSAKSPFTRQRVTINELVRELADLLVVTVGKRVRVELQLAARSPVVVTDPTQLRQVLMNLVHNAADAMVGREGGIVVRTSEVHLEPKNAASLSPGDYARLEVVDSGVGIEPGSLDRVFDPFFTTKKAGRGLGLSAVRSIAHRHGGGVLVESVVGQGSTFTVLLPLAAPEVIAPPPAQDRRAREFPAGATVLVIDDDPAVLRVLCDILKEFGLVALAAGGVAAGRSLFTSHPEIRAVLLDLTMPEGGGVPLVKEFHQLRPGAPILLISGYAESDITASMAGELSAFLAKPFTPMALKEALLRVVH